MLARLNFEKNLPRLRKEYKSLDRWRKSQMLDQLGRMTGYHRKYLIARLSKGSSSKPSKKKSLRSPKYSEAAIRVLYQVWKRSGQLSCERLKEQWPLLKLHAPLYISGCTEQIMEEISAISARQMTRRLAKYRRRDVRSKSRTTPATSRSRLLRHIVPVSTRRERDCPPGLLEVDTVAHCGDTLQGQFAWTLNTTDVATGWAAFAPVIGTSAQAVVPALEHIAMRAPFPVDEIHSDNGSEFINNHLVQLCHKRHIRMTRGRPGCKNDNPRIEQKNWTQVRQIVGYRRYETPAQLRQLSVVYYYLERLVNLFEPSAKLHSKHRQDAKVHRSYDTPMTPLQRLVNHYRKQGKRIPKKVSALVKLQKTLDPFQLYRQLDQAIEKLQSLPTTTSHTHSKENTSCLKSTAKRNKTTALPVRF